MRSIISELESLTPALGLSSWLYTTRKMSCVGFWGIGKCRLAEDRQFLQMPYSQRSDRMRIGSKPEHAAAQTASRRQEQGMVCLFRDWENLGQLLCLRLGSDAQTSQSRAEDGTRTEGKHHDSLFEICLWLYVKQTNDDDDNVNNDNNLHLLSSFQGSFSKTL